MGKVWISGLCDPYQPLEAHYQLSRKCLEILVENNWPVVIQTRSPLVLRDIDILKKATNIQVGFSVTTANDKIRKLFEPMAPAIDERLQALGELHRSGIRTYAMIAPILPGAEALADQLKGKIDYLLIDRMNYHYADWIYREYGLMEELSDDYFTQTGEKLARTFADFGIPCNLVF